ncbi:MAG TPA: helix-turn-helix transcriptional regulator [Nakamurella sp.]
MRLIEGQRRTGPLNCLTNRGRDVLTLMAEGRTNIGVARRLWLTDRTVATHIGSILAKLGLANTDEDHRRVLAVLTYRTKPSADPEAGQGSALDVASLVGPTRRKHPPAAQRRRHRPATGPRRGSVPAPLRSAGRVWLPGISSSTYGASRSVATMERRHVRRIRRGAQAQQHAQLPVVPVRGAVAGGERRPGTPPAGGHEPGRGVAGTVRTPLALSSASTTTAFSNDAATGPPANRSTPSTSGVNCRA